MPNGVEGSWCFRVATAYAILGVKIEPQRLRADVNVVGCDHDVTKKEAFCPTCGKEAWAIKNHPVPAFVVGDSALKNAQPECNSTFAGWRILLDDQHSPKFAYVGQICDVTIGGDVHSPNKAGTFTPCGELTDVRDKLKASLEPLGFWEEGAFGLWVVCWAREH